MKEGLRHGKVKRVMNEEGILEEKQDRLRHREGGIDRVRKSGFQEVKMVLKRGLCGQLKTIHLGVACKSGTCSLWWMGRKRPRVLYHKGREARDCSRENLLKRWKLSPDTHWYQSG